MLVVGQTDCIPHMTQQTSTVHWSERVAS